MLQDKLVPLHKALFLENNPGGIKYAVSRLGPVPQRVPPAGGADQRGERTRHRRGHAALPGC